MKLVAVCDRQFDGSGTLLPGVRYHQSYQELLTENLDALIVCMTNDIASEVTIAGLESGLHVFCEKPPGRNMKDIVAVMDVEKKHPDQVLMYGFNHRYHDSVQDAVDIVRSGEFGRIINLRGVYGKSKLVTFDQGDWRTKREIAGGGVLLDQGIHMVDLMRLFAGEFSEVQSIVTNSYWGYDVEDNVYAIMSTKDNVIGMLNSSATQWRHQFRLDINMQYGSLVLGGLLTGSKSYGDETLVVAKVDHETNKGNPREQTTRYNYDPSWESEMAQFAKSISTNTKQQHGTSRDAFETMKLVHKIYYADSIWREKYGISDPEVYDSGE